MALSSHTLPTIGQSYETPLARDPSLAELRRLDVLVWLVVAAVASLVLMAMPFAGFRLAPKSFIVPGAGLTVLMLGAWFYRGRRREDRFSSALEGTAQIAAFTAMAAPLSYIAASMNFPLHDRLFDTMDRALGFDWPALLAWMNAHPGIHVFFDAAYCSFMPQATVTVLALAFTARLVRLRVFLLAFMLSAIVTIVISAVLPAEGVWGFYKLSSVDYPAIVPVTRELHLPIFHGLRDGTFRTLMASGSEGIISFPSLHAALGVIFILALWPVSYLRWVGLAVNLLMIGATPVDGGHYFSDVIAGIAIALVCWIAASRLIARCVKWNMPLFRTRRPDLVPGE
jgi:membrane-associated phospholipid phosphatase